MELIHMQETLCRTEVYNSEKGPHLAILPSWSWTSSLQECEKQISVVHKQLLACYFVTAAHMD